MRGRIRDKVSEIEAFLKELDAIRPRTLSAYRKDLKARAACERYFEKIAEALVDVAFLVLKDEGMRLPEDDKAAFSLLAQRGIINDKLCRRLREAKGMRNILAHQYGAVDDELVFTSITGELERDARAFLKLVKAKYA